MNMNNKEKNTYVREHLLDTLLKLMKSESFDSIAINRLVNEAGVGRASFYRNYSSKEDILRQEADRLKSELQSICQNDDPTDIQLKLIKTLDFYKLHSEFYQSLYRAGFKHIIEDSIIDEIPLDSPLPNGAAYALSGFSYLIYGWIIEWIKRGLKEDSAEIVEMFNNNQNH